MNRRPATQASRIAAVTTMLAASLMWSAACGTDGNPSGFQSGTGGAGASTGGGLGPCTDGDVRECKVDLDELNCFVGVQECQGESWGPCVEGEGTLALGGSGPCPNNPCNPGCNEYDETPATPITGMGTPPPPTSTATIYDVAATIANACLDDTAHTCGSQCTSSGYCQLDTRCGTNGDVCEPWDSNEFDGSSGGVNLTVGIACDPSRVPVCNRGDTTGGQGAQISIWSADEDICGGTASCAGALSTGIASSGATQLGTCGPLPNDLAPGECAFVDCSTPAYTEAMYHVNGCDEFGCPISETNSDDNWGYYSDGLPCSCSSTAVSVALQPVTMYMVLDNSGSMSSAGIWVPAQTATKAFITDPGSDSINFAMRMYGNDPVSGCDDNACSIAACAAMAHGPDFLSNTTHENNLVNYIDNMTTGGNGTPHSASLGGATSAASSWAQANPTDLVAVVYISDGASDGCGANNNQVAQFADDAFTNDGVLTYTVALPGASLPLLNAIASDGGTGGAINLTGSGDVANDLTAALQQIQGSLFSCTISIPNASSVDPSQSTAIYLPSAGGQTTVTKVTGSGACSGANEYYFEPDETNPTGITLCPNLCTTVRNDVGGSLAFTGACATNYASYGVVETYTGNCGGGELPIWEFLSYDTTITGDASVEWEISTSAVDEATAAMGPWTSVSTATSANPDVPGGSPIDLEALLGPPAQAPYIALRMTLNPTSDGSTAPTVNSWSLQYTCQDAL